MLHSLLAFVTSTEFKIRHDKFCWESNSFCTFWKQQLGGNFLLYYVIQIFYHLIHCKDSEHENVIYSLFYLHFGIYILSVSFIERLLHHRLRGCVFKVSKLDILSANHSSVFSLIFLESCENTDRTDTQGRSSHSWPISLPQILGRKKHRPKKLYRMLLEIWKI